MRGSDKPQVGWAEQPEWHAILIGVDDPDGFGRHAIVGSTELLAWREAAGTFERVVEALRPSDEHLSARPEHETEMFDYLTACHRPTLDARLEVLVMRVAFYGMRHCRWDRDPGSELQLAPCSTPSGYAAFRSLAGPPKLHARPCRVAPSHPRQLRHSSTAGHQ